MINYKIRERMDELIREGEQLWDENQKTPGRITTPVRFSQWTTSCLNLLDHLSISTNRFVLEFESWVRLETKEKVNVGAALGVLKSARDEYLRGFAVDYHLSVASAVFGDLLSQAEYLHGKDYLRASAVLLRAALEEALKMRAKAELLEISDKETITPLLHKLKKPEVGIITELQSKHLEGVAKIGNDAAHSRPFEYQSEDIHRAIEEVRATIGRLLSER